MFSILKESVAFDTGYAGSNGLEPQSWVNGNGPSYIFYGSGQFDGQGSGHDFFGTVRRTHLLGGSRKGHTAVLEACSGCSEHDSGFGGCGVLVLVRGLQFLLGLVVLLPSDVMETGQSTAVQ
eukprot:2287085-Rhodomonas_salina.1